MLDLLEAPSFRVGSPRFTPNVKPPIIDPSRATPLYFVYDYSDGQDTFSTAEDAINEYAKRLANMRCCGDEWPEETESLCIGIIAHDTVLVPVEPTNRDVMDYFEGMDIAEAVTRSHEIGLLDFR